jgi:hypothetical protein
LFLGPNILCCTLTHSYIIHKGPRSYISEKKRKTPHTSEENMRYLENAGFLAPAGTTRFISPFGGAPSEGGQLDAVNMLASGRLKVVECYATEVPMSIALNEDVERAKAKYNELVQYLPVGISPDVGPIFGVFMAGHRISSFYSNEGVAELTLLSEFGL